MYTRYATKITAASISLLAVTVFFALAVQSQNQEPAQDKPQEKQPAAATQSPSPATKQQDKKLGTELDDRSLITNTDLITLTVTVRES